jgi:hypothetical protein
LVTLAQLLAAEAGTAISKAEARQAIILFDCLFIFNWLINYGCKINKNM